MNERIVVAEDDESIRRLMEVTLSSHGYVPAVFANAEDALRDMEAAPPSVVIFDIMMEGMGGLEGLRRVRQSKTLRHVPVILLTALDSELDKIVGLDAGADDYITKPFSVLELCARVRSQLRRVAEQKGKRQMYQAGDLNINIATREVIIDGHLLELTFKEFELLRELIEHQDRAVTRAELLSKVWGDDFYGETRTLDIHVATLRQKIRAASSHDFIKTIRGIGYRFIAP